MATPVANAAIEHYDARISFLAANGETIPMNVPLGRYELIRLLHRVQLAELYDPKPELDGGSE